LAAFLDRTINEVKSLDTEYQNRLLQAVHEAESAVQSQAAQHLDVELREMRVRLEEQFNVKVLEVSAQWESERERLSNELVRASQAATQWESERARLNAEIERLKQSEMAARAEAERAIEAANAAASTAAAAPQAAALNSDVLIQEMQRVESLIEQITAVIDDPAVDLSTIIRKNVERSELGSYLKGIRFALEQSRAE
jgi:hypothetical protein